MERLITINIKVAVCLRRSPTTVAGHEMNGINLSSRSNWLPWEKQRWDGQISRFTGRVYIYLLININRIPRAMYQDDNLEFEFQSSQHLKLRHDFVERVFSFPTIPIGFRWLNFQSNATLYVVSESHTCTGAAYHHPDYIRFRLLNFTNINRLINIHPAGVRTKLTGRILSLPYRIHINHRVDWL